MRPRLSDALERWLAPQERFEALRRDTMRRKTHVCDLSYANAYDGPSPAALQAIRGALDSPRTLDLQYTPYGGSTITRRLIAEDLTARYALPFEWRDVVLTPGAMAALTVLFRAVKSTDSRRDEVVVIIPCWMDYPLYLAQWGLTPVFVPVRSDLHLNLDAIAEALGPDTRAVVLSQPANPSGIVYTRDELRALAGLLSAQADPPLLISDECHRDVRDSRTPVTSPVECYDQTCVIYSFGKSFLIQGQRIGYAAVSPKLAEGRAFSVHLERVCRMTGVCTPTALMQLAVRALLGKAPDVSLVLARRARAVAALRDAGFDVTEPDATFFLYPRAPEPDDFSFVERLAAAGVLALPSSLFHHPGHFRLCLTASDGMVDEALGVLARTVMTGPVS